MADTIENQLLNKAAEGGAHSNARLIMQSVHFYEWQRQAYLPRKHPQCFVAKEYMEDLATIPDRILEQANVQLVTVGPHAPELLRVFKEETGFRHQMFCDPKAAIYKAIGFKCDTEPQGQYPAHSKHVKSGWVSGVLSSTYRAAVWYRDFRADMRVNGGCLVLGPGRVLQSSHLDNGMFDQMPINSMLQLVCGVTMSFPRDRRVLQL